MFCPAFHFVLLIICFASLHAQPARDSRSSLPRKKYPSLSDKNDFEPNRKRRPINPSPHNGPVGSFPIPPPGFDYDGEEGVYDMGEESSSSSAAVQRHDLTDKYRGIPALVLISLSTTLSSFLLLSFLCKMILSFVPVWITALLAVVMSLSVFLKSSHLGIFSKALGVVFLELIRKAKVYSFLRDLNRYVNSSLNFKERKPYPPGDNPWKYV